MINIQHNNVVMYVTYMVLTFLSTYCINVLMSHTIETYPPTIIADIIGCLVISCIFVNRIY